ncbi:MAG: cytidylate kinase-like family protein [Lachnospiraceae bacterium]|nr:cytidylate kinase-like family protein [Lachnospiraceae bacterium]
MTDNLIITIGREYGSGGHEIGEQLAKQLGVKCYDKELLELAAKDSGLCSEILEHHDERPTNSFLYNLVMDTYSLGYSAVSNYIDMPINHKVFLAQFDAIKKLAEKESCVIVGRCADYALEEYPNVVRVFVHAPYKSRVERIKERRGVDDNKAFELITKTDKSRANYYNYYSSKKWGEAKTYDLTIDSSKLGLEGSIAVIKAFIEARK